MIQSLKEKLYPSYKTVKSLVFFPVEMYRYHKQQSMNEVRKKFADSFTIFKVETKKTNQFVLVQKVSDYENTIKLAAAGKAIAEKYACPIKVYEADWTSYIGWKYRYRKLYHLFNKSYSAKLHDKFSDGIVFSTEDRYFDQKWIKKQFEDIKMRLTTPESLMELKFENIHVGDLLYDTYLRYFHQPTIENINAQILLIVEIGLNIFYNFLHFLKNNQIKALVNTYSSYIEHGLTARICLSQNTPVYTIGSYSYILQKLSIDFPYHQINHTEFSPDKKLEEQQLNEAKSIFVRRFEGKIDPATRYMKSSAFGNRALDPTVEKLFKIRKRNLVIYIHDFYDSPHVNRKLIFLDLYQYLKQTLLALTKLEDTSVFVKIHPNGMPGCKEKAIELVESFHLEHFHVLPDGVSNNHIIDLKPDLIATARGTVCLEMAYFGIPTVALFDNLYANFPFTHTCYDKESYFAILKGEQKPENIFNLEHVFSFYYQAFLEKTAKENNEIFDILAAKKGASSDDSYLSYLFTTSYLEKRQILIEHYKNVLETIE